MMAESKLAKSTVLRR